MSTFHNDKSIRIDYDSTIMQSAFERIAIGPHKYVLFPVIGAIDESTQIIRSETGDDINPGTVTSPKLSYLASALACSGKKTKVVSLTDDLRAEDLSSLNNDYFIGFYSAPGIQAKCSLRTLDYEDDDTNTIYVDDIQGNDNTGDGTNSSKVATVEKAYTLLTVTKCNIMLCNSNSYIAPYCKTPADLRQICAKIGESPELQIRESKTVYNRDYVTLYQESFATDSYDSFGVLKLSNDDLVIAYGRNVSSVHTNFFMVRSKDGSIRVPETIISTHSADWHYQLDKFSDDSWIVLYSVGNTHDCFHIYDKDGNVIKSDTIVPNSTCDVNDLCVLPDNTCVIIHSRYNTSTISAASYFSKIDKMGNFIISDKELVNYCGTASLNVLSNGNIVNAYDGKFVILDQSGNTVVAETIISSVGTNRLTYSNCITVFEDRWIHCFRIREIIGSTWYYKPYFVVYDNAGNQIVAPTNFLEPKSLGKFELHKLGEDNCIFISCYGGSNSSITNLTYAVIDSSGNIVTGPHDICEVGASSSFEVLSNGVIVTLLISGSTVSYSHILPYLVTGLLAENPLTLNGLFLNDCGLLPKGRTSLIESSNTELSIYNCSVKDINTEEAPGYNLIKTVGDFIFKNSAIPRLNTGIYVESNTVTIQNILCYGNTPDYVIHINGAGSNILLGHITATQNKGVIRIENNDGTEIIKNCILYSNYNFGINADTEVTYTRCVNTDAHNNAVIVSPVVIANPLFKNEGLINPDDIDLHLQHTILGDNIDSPACNLGDDGRDAGCYDLVYLGASEDWKSITILKSINVDIDIVPVGSVQQDSDSGDTETSVKGWKKRVKLTYKGMKKEDFDAIRNVFMTSGNRVRLYFDPVSNPTEYEVFKKVYNPMPASPKDYRFGEIGVQDTSFEFVRKYEVE